MKAIFLGLIAFLLCSGFKVYGVITYKVMEYVPKGRNYSLKTYPPVYTYVSGYSTSEIVWIFYTKTNSQYYLTALMASKTLEQKLPSLVLNYIGEKIASPKLVESKSPEAVKEAVRLAVEKALDQKYKDLLLKEGTAMVQDSSYYRGYCNTNWWMPDYYYDYEPEFSKDTINTFLLNNIEDSRFAHLEYVTKELKKFGYHHDLKTLAKWPDKVMSGSGFKRSGYTFSETPIKSDISYHNRADSCRFALKKTPISHGKKYPRFASVSYFGWYATYCNFFASDLQKKIFTHKLWTTNGCSDDMIYLKTNMDFIELPKDQIIKYSNAGYFVFMISKSHISTIFPNEEEGIKVVQAGDKTGILDLTSIWGKGYKEDTEIVGYLYLGYLKSKI
jgi:hypothetical protein